jgi:hypothetical protein
VGVRSAKSNALLTYKKIVRLREASCGEGGARDERKDLITLGQRCERGHESGRGQATALDRFGAAAGCGADKKGVEGAHSQKNFR